MPYAPPPSTQFNLFEARPGKRAPPQAEPKRRVALPDLIKAVGDLRDDELSDLLGAATEEAKWRGIAGREAMEAAAERVGATAKATSRGTETRAASIAIPPGKLNLIRAALRAGFSKARVAREFGVSPGARKGIDPKTRP